MLDIGDLNIDTLKNKKYNGKYFSDLGDSFFLKNLMTDITCVKSINRSSIDVLMTIKSRSFIRILNTEILKTFTKMISSMNLILNLAKKLFVNSKIISKTF